MMLLNILTFISFAAALSVLLYIILKHDHLSRFISAKKLGVIERDLQGLIQVIVLANIIERPSDTLAEAVEDNFSEGVNYLFLVSNTNAERQVRGYYQMFEALARIAAEKSKENILASELVNIKRLPYEWPDVPYIFYRFKKPHDSDVCVLGFRGNQKKEGIADYYERLSYSHSQAMVSALLAEAPQDISGLKLIEKVRYVNESINEVL